jgi:hypothetical protein
MMIIKKRKSIADGCLSVFTVVTPSRSNLQYSLTSSNTIFDFSSPLTTLASPYFSQLTAP